MLTSESEKINELSNKILNQASDLKKLSALLNTEITKNAILSAKLQQSEETVRLKDSTIYNLNNKIDVLNDTINKLKASISWRLTKPLRETRTTLTKITSSQFDGRFMRLLLLFYWTFTFKLSAKLDQEKNYNKLIDDYINLIEKSEYFDKNWYLQQYPDIAKAKTNPATHYLLFGYKEGRNPGPMFDTYWYLTQYPDVMEANMNPLVHYLIQGKNEGRQPNSLLTDINETVNAKEPATVKKLTRKSENIIVVSHDATRSGAPVLTYNVIKELKKKYNVIVMLLEAGDLTQFFKEEADLIVGPFDKSIHESEQLYTVVETLKRNYPINYAVVNSVASNSILDPLTRNSIPIVTLIHEYASCIHKPEVEFGKVRDFSHEIIFSTADTLKDAVRHVKDIDKKSLNIIPQGLCNVPDENFQKNAIEHERVKNALRPIQDDTILVIGCGTVYLRKGIDVFISTAKKVSEQNPGTNIKFIWFGNTYNPDEDMEYCTYLANQIERSNLKDKMIFFGEVTSMDAVFECADIFYLSSRVDPLPNVAIQAMQTGLPVVCFENAGGIPDLLTNNPKTKDLVVPHLDDYAASQMISRLIKDKNLRQDYGELLKELAKETFKLEDYVLKIDELGQRAKLSIEQRKTDEITINNDSDFNPDVYLIPYIKHESRDRALAISKFVYQWSINYPHCRKPCVGFNPQIYKYHNKINSQYNENPFAHYIRAGKPAGIWNNEVIDCNQKIDIDKIKKSNLRIALHAHFYYTDLIGEFKEALSVNNTPCDLFFSTCNSENQNNIKKQFENYALGQVMVKVVSNSGRDLKPFLTDFKDEWANYDVIGHMHAKKSIDASMGNLDIGVIWRNFLWQNLIGNKYPMLDNIVYKFASDPKTGLVFPDDPNLVNWSRNKPIAMELAHRLKLQKELPEYFNFPVGTMFWARYDVLKPILDLNLTETDYPYEPIPLDATMLHALERLFSIVCEDLGYKNVLTYVPGYIR